MPPTKFSSTGIRQLLSLLLTFALWSLLVPLTHSAKGRIFPKKARRPEVETSDASKTNGASSKSIPPDTERSAKQSKNRIIESYGRIPLSFEPNQGQADSRAKFLSRGS